MWSPSMFVVSERGQRVLDWVEVKVRRRRRRYKREEKEKKKKTKGACCGLQQ